MSILTYYENLSLGCVKRQEANFKNSVFGNSFEYQKDIKGHKGCVNAIEFSPDEDLVVSGGDDLRTLVWRTSDLLLDKTPVPAAVMKTQHLSNIFTNRFDMTGTKLYSGGNDNNVIRHDVETTELLTTFNFGGSVYCIDTNPVDENVFSVSTEDGWVRFFDCRERKQGILDIYNRASSMYCGQYSPSYGAAFVVAGSRCGVRLYDLRNIKRDYPKKRDTKCVCNPFEKPAMYACWNSVGTALAVLSAARDPLYIDLLDKKKMELCDDHYTNVHTIKSVEFINDHTVITGSDDFKLYAWRVVDRANDEHDDGVQSGKESNDEFIVAHKDEVYEFHSIANADFILEGHRSIVNQVRFSPANNILLTSGVEKILKCWSSLEIPESYQAPNIRNVGSFRRNWQHRRIMRPRRLMDMGSDGEEDGGEQNDREEDDEMNEDRQMLHYFDTMIMNDRNLNVLMLRPQVRNSPIRRGRRPMPLLSSSEDSDGQNIPLPGVDLFFDFQPDNAESDDTSSSDSSNEDEDANMESESDSDSSDGDGQPDVDEAPRPITVYPPESSSSDSE